MGFVSQWVEIGRGPVLVFGGPVSNLQAVQGLRDWATAAGIPPQRVICTGDVVAYCGDPVATVQAVRDWGCHVVAGNCERALAVAAESCGCGFEAGSTCDRLSAGWFGFAASQVSAEDRAWMAGLPDEIAWSGGVACHGGYTDIARFLWPVSPDSAFVAELAARQALATGDAPALVVAGHCGVPFSRRIGQTLWVNAGSSGMPPNDGRAETCFAVIDGDSVAHHRLSYDWQGAQARMREVGLVQGYETCLETGIWPSQDVLPTEMRRGTV